jgi:hypothetical protein
MRRRKMPHFIRLSRLALKSVWYALIIPNDPYHEKKVNFWNIPIRKRESEYREHSPFRKLNMLRNFNLTYLQSGIFFISY